MRSVKGGVKKGWEGVRRRGVQEGVNGVGRESGKKVVREVVREVVRDVCWKFEGR